MSSSIYFLNPLEGSSLCFQKTFFTRFCLCSYLIIQILSMFYKTFLHAMLEYLTWMNWIVWLSESIIFLWRKAILKYSTLLFPTIASHIEITPLADGMYELTQDLDGDFSKAQANTVELTEAPNFDSEDPESTDPIATNTGKPRCIILLFYATYYCFLLHLCYWSWVKT